MIAGSVIGANVRGFTPSDFGRFGTNNSDISFWSILSANLIVVIVLIVGGVVSLGLISIFTILYNGIQLGVVSYAILAFHPSSVILLLPHAFTEIPAVVIATAIGIKPLLTTYAYLRGNLKVFEEYVSKESLFPTLELLSVSIFLITVSAVIESFVTGAIFLRP